jgi:phage protein D
MTKAPWFDVLMGDTTIDEMGLRNLVSSVECESELGKFGKAKMVLKSGPALEEAYALVKHGNITQITMGYVGGVIQKMFLGFLHATEPDFAQQTVTLHFQEYLKALDVGEKDRVLSGKTIEQVVRAVIADYAPLVVGTIDNGDTILSETISQSKKTDFKLLEEIASSFAMKWKLSPTETSGVWAISLYNIDFEEDTSQYKSMYTFPDKEHQYNDKNIHLKNFKPKSNILSGVSSKITIESNNASQPISVHSKQYNPDVYVQEARGSEIVYRVFGTVNRIHFYENVTDEEAAQIISDQLLQEDELKFVSARDTQLSEGDALVRVGQRRDVIIKGIPIFDKVFSGKYTIVRTKHKVDVNSGYDTWVDLSRERLTVPDPGKKPTGGGGYTTRADGTPVIVYIYDSNTFYAYYVNFVPGGYELGGRIPRDEFLANSHWMAHMVTAGWGEITGWRPIWGTRYSYSYVPNIVDTPIYPTPFIPSMPTTHTSTLVSEGEGAPLGSKVGEVKIDWAGYQDLQLSTSIYGMTDNELLTTEDVHGMVEGVQAETEAKRLQALQDAHDARILTIKMASGAPLSPEDVSNYLNREIY